MRAGAVFIGASPPVGFVVALLLSIPVTSCAVVLVATPSGLNVHNFVRTCVLFFLNSSRHMFPHFLSHSQNADHGPTTGVSKVALPPPPLPAAAASDCAGP